MREFFWIQKHRSRLFALELLIVLVFGPALAKAMWDQAWGYILFCLTVLVVCELTLVIATLILGVIAKKRGELKHKNLRLAYEELQSDTKDMGVSAPAKKKVVRTKKKRKKKGKKTHRKK